MRTRTIEAVAACASLCLALASCGGKDKKGTDADAGDTIGDDDVSDMTDATDTVEDTEPDAVEDPTPDTVEDPVPDTVEDPTPDTVEDPTLDTVEDPTPDTVEDPTPDTVVDTIADTVVDSSVDTADDADVDTTPDVVTPPVLFFSEYVEGSGNNKAVEILNGGSAGYRIDLCSVRLYYNGSATPGATIALSAVTLAADDVHVLCHTGFTSTGTSPCDQTHGSLSFNGDDAVELVCDGTVMDVIGQIGTDPGSEWGTGLVSTADNTLRRKCTITAGDPVGSDAFDPSVEWDGYAIDTFTDLGAHCP